jgi:transcriptional regulator
MLIRPVDAARDDAEWQTLIAASEYGQLIVPRAERPDALPVVVPSHFVYDGDRRIELHLAKPNPVWEAVGEGCEAIFTVLGPFVYIPTDWSANPGTPVEYGVPTSYYAAVVASGWLEPVHDHDELAALLTRQLGRFQAEGGHAPVVAGDNPYGRLLRAIGGLRLEILDVRAKFKFGGNKAPEHQRTISERLAERAGPGDAAARTHQLRRLDSPGVGD